MIAQWGVDDPGARHKLEALDSGAALSAATWIREALLGDECSTQPIPDLEGAIESLGFFVERRRLMPEAGGAQAHLIPSGPSRFSVPVDPTPTSGWRDPDNPMREEIERHRVRFLVAHELAHSVFFDQDDRLGYPTRVFPATPQEEEFCDECARWILVPRSSVQALPVESDSVLRLHRDFDVSVEVAARAFAAVFGARTIVAYGEAEAHWQVQWDSAGALAGGARFTQAPDDRGQEFSITRIPGRNQVVLVGA